jgi:uncharacterized membrane protein YqjE
MTDQQPSTDSTTTQNIAQAIQEVSDRATLLVREEIELAKAEVTEKVTKLIKGAVVGIAAGIFIVFALIYLLHGFAWLTWYELFPDQQYFWGFFVVAAVLLLLGALAGYIAARAMKSGAPPTPVMAIDEAKRIKETVQSPHPERTI